MRVTKDQWREGYKGFAESNLYTSTRSALRNSEKKMEAGIEKILYGEEETSIEGLQFDQLISDAQRALYIQQSLQDFSLSQDFNFPLIAHYINGFTSDQYNTFIKKVEELAQKDERSMITMHDVDKAFASTLLIKTSKGMAQSMGVSDEDLNEYFNLCQTELATKYQSDPTLKVRQAYHEAAHALLFAIHYSGFLVTHLSLIPVGTTFGASITQLQSKAILSSPTESQISHVIDQKLSFAKNKIKGFLAGGIGHEIYNGEKLKFLEFLQSPKYSQEIGNPYIAGSDIYQAYEEAAYYCKFKNFNLVSMYQEDLESYVGLSPEELQSQVMALLEECYDETYAILDKNKDMLNNIVAGTLHEGVTSGDKIYQMAGITRPKYDFELTLREKLQNNIIKWLSWTHKRIAFYERHHPQV
jgi:hypothetical protein